MDKLVIILDLIPCLFAVGLGFGLSCWILGVAIEKSNNIGDSRGTSDDYKAFIRFTCRQDNLSVSERKSFCEKNYVKIDDASSRPDSWDKVRRLSDEELARYENSTAEDAAAKREDMLKGTDKRHGIFD